MSDSDFARALSHVNIEDEMRQSYMDYAMSVIVVHGCQLTSCP